MPIQTNQQLLIALKNDLSKSDSAVEVVDEPARKTFTVIKDGTVLQFSHKQPDNEYWNGVKYYGSGKQSKIRLRRTPAEAATP